MKQNKNVYIKRSCAVVELHVKYNTKEGDYITSWLNKKDLLGDAMKLILAMPEANASAYSIKTKTKKCSIAKGIEKLMKQKIQSALSNMPKS